MPESVKNGQDGQLYEKCLIELESKGDARYGICMTSYQEHHMKDSDENLVRKPGHILEDGKWMINHSELPDWIAIFRGGVQIDSSGNSHNGDELIKKAVESFNVNIHEPPIRLNHEDNGGMSYGWIKSLKVDDLNGTKTLFAKLDATDELINLIKSGKYKKRSAGFTPDGKLHHLAMLGSSVPAVKGLPDINLDDGENNINNFNFEEVIMEDEVKTQEVIPEIKFSEDELNSKLEEQKIKLETEFDKKLNDTIKKFEEDIKNIKFEQDKKDIKIFLDELSQNGKILPKDVNGLQNFCESLLDSGSFNFEEKSVSKLDYFKSFLNGKETNTTLFKEFDNSNVQLPSNKDDLVNQLIKDKEKTGMNFRDALLSINKENPDLFQ